ncbi:hypothetical protein L838_4966 [Mycobacterium avium MAV_120709_2344]|nr:hypothetical protein L838_4966 [Mycobacterium avium MAV_120709_2344]
MHRRSTPSDFPMWKFVARSNLGDLDTYLWHRQGSNQFCWRPVGKPWGGRKKADDAD